MSAPPQWLSALRSGSFPVLLLTVPLPPVVAPVACAPMRWFSQSVPNAGLRKSPIPRCRGCGGSEARPDRCCGEGEDCCCAACGHAMGTRFGVPGYRGAVSRLPRAQDRYGAAAARAARRAPLSAPTVGFNIPAVPLAALCDAGHGSVAAVRCERDDHGCPGAGTCPRA